MAALKRNINPTLLAALGNTPIYPIIFVYLDWPDAAVRVHSNVGDIVWDGFTWKGIGNFGALQMPGEETGLISQPAQLRLVGAPDELDQYLDDPIRDRDGEVWFGLTTARAGNTLIGSPFSIYTGYMDAMRDTVQDEDGNLRRDLVIDLAGGPSQRSYTDLFHTYEDQQLRHPGDTAGRLVQNAEAERDRMTWPD